MLIALVLASICSALSVGYNILLTGHKRILVEGLTFVGLVLMNTALIYNNIQYIGSVELVLSLIILSLMGQVIISDLRTRDLFTITLLLLVLSALVLTTYRIISSLDSAVAMGFNSSTGLLVANLIYYGGGTILVVGITFFMRWLAYKLFTDPSEAVDEEDSPFGWGDILFSVFMGVLLGVQAIYALALGSFVAAIWALIILGMRTLKLNTPTHIPLLPGFGVATLFYLFFGGGFSL